MQEKEKSDFRLPLWSPVKQPSEDDRQNSWSADGRTEADEAAPLCEHHAGGRSWYKHTLL